MQKSQKNPVDYNRKQRISDELREDAAEEQALAEEGTRSAPPIDEDTDVELGEQVFARGKIEPTIEK